MEELIYEAINNRKLLQVYYDPGIRIIAPHETGISEISNYLLLAWQLNGASMSGQPKGWKLFYINQLDVINILDAGFRKPYNGYRPSTINEFGRTILHLPLDYVPPIPMEKPDRFPDLPTARPNRFPDIPTPKPNRFPPIPMAKPNRFPPIPTARPNRFPPIPNAL